MLRCIPFIGRLFARKDSAANFAPGVHLPMASDIADLNQRLGHERADALIRKHAQQKPLRKHYDV